MSEREKKEGCAVCVREAELARLQVRQEWFDRRLEAYSASQARLLKKIDELIPAVARLEVKAGVWGGLGGVLAALSVVAAGLAIRM